MQEVYVNGEEFDKAEDVWEYLKEELGLEAGVSAAFMMRLQN